MSIKSKLAASFVSMLSNFIMSSSSRHCSEFCPKQELKITTTFHIKAKLLLARLPRLAGLASWNSSTLFFFFFFFACEASQTHKLSQLKFFYFILLLLLFLFLLFFSVNFLPSTFRIRNVLALLCWLTQRRQALLCWLTQRRQCLDVFHR